MEKTAYVLSGGGGKIGFAAGVICKLNDISRRPSIIAGVSSGNLAGIMAATDQYKLLKELLFDLTDDQVIKKRKFLTYLKRFGMHRLGIMNPKFGLYDNSPLADLLNETLLGKRLVCDFYTGVVDIKKDEFLTHFIPKGAIVSKRDLKYVLASTSIPFVFPPVKVDGKLLVDGGLHYHTPFEPVKELIKDRGIQIDELIAVSMMNPDEGVSDFFDIRDDLEMAPVVLRGILSRAHEEDIKQFELMNLVTKKFGKFAVGGKTYKYYPGKIFRPLKKLAPSLSFHHRHIIPDFIHGYELV